MFKPYHLIIIALFLYSISPHLQAKPNPAGFQQASGKIAYSIVTPGKNLPDGSVQAASVQHIYRLKPGEYQQNVIHVKTRQRVPLEPGSKGFYSSNLMKGLAGIGVEQIRAPFAEFSLGNLQSAENFGVDRIFEVYYSSPVDPYDICIELMKNPDVEYACPVFVRHTCDYTPNDSLLNQQYHLTLMNARGAWGVSKGDKSVKIAIVDTGTDWTHIDLASNIWTNPNEIAGDGLDNDNNGKIDDIHGWDFVGNINLAEAQTGSYKEDNDPRNLAQSHGTHTAGCAAAVTDNRHGIASLGFGCSIIPVKCASDNSGVSGVFRGYEGIMYAAKLGAKVINCSWGGQGYSPAESDVLNQVTAMGSLVVASAGNESTNMDDVVFYPAGHPMVLSVGSSSANDLPSTSFSNFGNRVRTYAPGENILSTLPNNRYAGQSGTSMSSPVVAGLAALVFSVFKDYTPMQVIAQIRSTSDNVLVSTSPTARPYFYGRANAAKAVQYNNPNFPDLNIPGVLATDISFSSGGALTNYEPTDVMLTIKNYISTIDGLTVKVTPVSNFIEISESELTLGSFAELETKDLAMSVKLLPNNPWYSGNAEVMLTFLSNGYEDYQLLQIPIQIQSTNLYSAKANFSQLFFWHDISTNNADVAWAAGQYGSSQAPQAGIYYRFAGGSTFNSVVANEALYCIHGFSANKAIAGTGPTNGNARVFMTTNGGTNWGSNSVSSITGFINDIQFYDDNNGILLGDPKGSVWGIGKSTDGGSSWNLVANVPQPLSNETGFVNSLDYLDDNIWFGTSVGRVYRSADKGETWQPAPVYSGGKVMFISFYDNNSGIAVYTESQQENAQYKCAATQDGGAQWELNVFNFTTSGMVPVYLYAIPGTRIIVAQLNNGSVMATEDLGVSWYPVLSKEQLSVQIGGGFTNGENVRLWGAGLNVGYLDFKFTPTDVKRTLSLTTTNSVDYGVMQLNNGKNERITVENAGNVSLNINSVEIIPDEGVGEDEFKIMFGMLSTLGVGKTTSATVRFRPVSEGIKTAKLKIISDAEPNEIIVELRGEGVIGNSVENNAVSTENLEISPNPVNRNANVNFTLAHDADIELVAYNEAGSLARKVFSGWAEAGKSVISIDFSNLNSGVYFVQLSANGKPVEVKRVVVVR